MICTLATPHLPLLSFLFGIFITYILLRLLPGYDETCSKINEQLHAPSSVIELLDQNYPPGSYPILPYSAMIDAFQSLLLAKDRKIADLQSNLEQEDEELADLIAQKDEEISNLGSIKQEIAQKDAEILKLRKIWQVNSQKDAEVSRLKKVLQRKDNEIAELQMLKMPQTSQPANTKIYLNLASRPVLIEQNRKLQQQLQAALASTTTLEQRVASQTNQADALNDEISNLRSEITAANTKLNGTSDKLEGRLSATVKDRIIKELRQEVAEFESRYIHESSQNARLQESNAAQCNRITELEAQLTQHHADAANYGQSIIDACNQSTNNLQLQVHTDQQTINNLQIQLHTDQQTINSLQMQLQTEQQTRIAVQNELLQKQSDLDNKTQQLDSCTEQLNNKTQQANTLETQLSYIHSQLANEQQAHQTTRNLPVERRFDDITNQLNVRQQRLTYLEEQLVLANQLHAEYERLKKEWFLLKEYADGLSQAQNQSNGNLPAQIQSLQNELYRTKQQIVELSNSKKQLEDPRKINPLFDIALAEKDKEIAKIRAVLQRAQDESNALRMTGNPSSDFLKNHERLVREKNALKARFNKLETKFYAEEIKVKDLSAREKKLMGKLEQYSPSGKGTQAMDTNPINKIQGQELNDMKTAFENGIQRERDEAVEKYNELVKEWEAIPNAALDIVKWQVDGGSEQEAEEKCRNLEKHLAERLKLILAEIRWKLQHLKSGMQSVEDQQFCKKQLADSAMLSTSSAGVANKRKGEEGEEEGTEREGKCLRQE